MKRTILNICIFILFAGFAQAQDPDIWGAMFNEDLGALQRLAKANADLEVKEPSGGSTPLIVAALLGKTKSARALVEHGARLDTKNNDGGTALHAAAFLCREDIVQLLLEKGAKVNAKNVRNETPLDTVRGAWDKDLEGIYHFLEEVLKIKLNLEDIRAARPKMAAMLRQAGGKTGGEAPKAVQRAPVSEKVAPTPFRGSYFVNGEIHVNTYGTPEGKPVTTGYQDFKPSWSKTGDMLVFFRRLKNHRVTVNWITQICVINADGTGFQPLTDGTHTDFNQTWTRDGTNTPIWNRKNPAKGGFQVMASKVGAKPGEEIALTDKRYHSWAYTCLMDGRILVQCAHPKQGWGYYLMTPNPGGEPKFQRIDCEMAKKGLLDRISISPSETRVCFEYQNGHKHKMTGRALYIADFDAKQRSITNAKPFANEIMKPHWYAYPRWTQDESAIVYHANKTGKGGLYLYTVADGTTRKVSTNPEADYRYPHMEDTPK